MLPPSRLCAAHASNHLVVQELMLYAALSSPHFAPNDGEAYLQLAKHIAQLPTACAKSIPQRRSRRGSVPTPWRHAPSLQLVLERVDQKLKKEHSLSAERRLPVCYDDAVEHQHSLERMLGPHGFRVALVGKMRCGCPAGPRAVFLLTDGNQSKFHSSPPKRDDKYNNNDSAVRGGGGDDQDGVIVFERAVKGLAACGYITIISKKKLWMCETSLTCFTCLAQTSSGCGPEPTCRGGREQELQLVWSSPRMFHLRRLFLTSPKPFLAHLMLLANAKGYELRHDGLYRRSEDTHEFVELRSEKNVFTALQIPYVDPLYRYLYCRLYKLV